MKSLYQFIFSGFFIAFVLFSGAYSAQENKTTLSDSLLKKKKLQEDISLSKNKKFYLDNKNSRKQYDIFSKLDAAIQEGNLVLKKGIDYKNFTAELKSSEYTKKLALDGVIVNPTKFQSVRNVTLTTTILNEILRRTNNHLTKIDHDQKEITNSQATIDSLIIDDALYQMPSDPKIEKLYKLRLNEINTDVDKINSRFKTALDSINKLQIDARKFKYELQNNILETDRLRGNIQENLFTQQTDIFNTETNPVSFLESMGVSFIKEFLLMVYYLSNHSYMLGLMLIFTLIIGSYLRILKKRYQQADIFDRFKYYIHIFDYPFLVSLIISVTILHFFFDHPPFSFLSLIWAFLLICFTVVSRKTFDRVQKRIWYIFAFLILLSFFANNLLIPSAGEVKFLLFLSVLIILVNALILLKFRQHFRNPYLIVFVAVTLLECLGIHLFKYWEL